MTTQTKSTQVQSLCNAVPSLCNSLPDTLPSVEDIAYFWQQLIVPVFISLDTHQPPHPHHWISFPTVTLTSLTPPFCHHLHQPNERVELTCAIQLRVDTDTDIEKKAEKNIHSSSDNTKHENLPGKHPFQVMNRKIIQNMKIFRVSTLFK